MSGARFAEVALPIPVDRAYAYRVPDSLAGRAAPGMRAVVPFGKRIETGVIVATPASCDREELKTLLDLPDDGPLLAPDMLALCRWIADYYCCAWGEALQTALPAGLKSNSAIRYRLVPERLDAGRYSDRQRRIVAALYKRGPLTAAQLASEAGATALSNTLQALVRRGVLIAEPVHGRSGVSIRTETYWRLVEEAVPDMEAVAAMQRRAPKQAAVYLDLLHGEPEQAATALYEKHQVNAGILRALEEKSLVTRVEREFYRRPDPGAHPTETARHALNADQQAAFDAIAAPLRAGQFQSFLLRGITGSGKTEVYLRVIEEALALHCDAIILVPEISLTPQTVGRFYARFGEQIAVLHSGLSPGERYDEWRRAQRGEVRIVVGARSAVFAPLPRVGVIVVDEEHDLSYKQGETPRYHARDVAIVRARQLGAVCVLGSATPSIEAYHNAEKGKSIRIDLTRRATAGALPMVTVLDMRVERKETAGDLLLAEPLERAVHERVAAGEQVILLLNRRGHSPYVLCPSCGWVAYCEDCQVSLTYHRVGGELRCHYCNAQRPRPEACEECGFAPLVFLGMGTQKAEDYLMRAFAGARVARMDADTTAGKGGHAKILGRFARGEIDILIGTQMLAKGHDYPGVTLVGVINADTSLAHPDFRAAEQTFQLLTQVAGRAGRGDRPGEVYIQTFRPKHFAIAAAQAHDYAGFYDQEIVHREQAGYPPFRRMLNVGLECEEPAAAERAALVLRRNLREVIEAKGFAGVEILGPAPASIKRIKKKYRWNIGVLSRSAKRLNVIARAARETFEKTPHARGVAIKVDLDPYGAF